MPSVKPLPTWPTHRSVPAVVGAHQQRAERRAAAALAGRPAEDHAVLRVRELDLAPVAAVRLPGRYRRAASLRHHALQRRARAPPRRTPTPSPSTWVTTWSRSSCSTTSSSSSRRSSSASAGRVAPVEPQQVERDQRDRDLLARSRSISRAFARFIRCWSASNEFLPSSSNATISPSITAFTWSTSSWIMWISGYCAVASRPVRVRSTVSPGRQLGEAADPVELRLEPPSGVVEGLPAALGEHRREPRRRGDQRRAPGAMARNASQSVRVLTKWNSMPGYRRPCSRNDHLRVGPLDRLVPAVVEDPDLAGAVVPLRDRARELPVLERVVLGLHGQAFVALLGRQALRHGPATAARRPAPDGRRSAGAWPGACGSRTSCPRRASSPGAGSVVPARPNSRRRTYSIRFGVLRGRAISSEVFAATLGAAVRGSRRAPRPPRPRRPAHRARSRRPRPGPSARRPTGRRRVANRSQTLSIRKSCGSNPPASTSSHVSGVETGARGSGRSE